MSNSEVRRHRGTAFPYKSTSGPSCGRSYFYRETREWGSASPIREEHERQQAQGEESTVAAAAARFRFLPWIGVSQGRSPVRHVAQRDARRSQWEPCTRGVSLQPVAQRLDGGRAQIFPGDCARDPQRVVQRSNGKRGRRGGGVSVSQDRGPDGVQPPGLDGDREQSLFR